MLSVYVDCHYFVLPVVDITVWLSRQRRRNPRTVVKPVGIHLNALSQHIIGRPYPKVSDVQDVGHRSVSGVSCMLLLENKQVLWRSLFVTGTLSI